MAPWRYFTFTAKDLLLIPDLVDHYTAEQMKTKSRNELKSIRANFEFNY